MRTLNTLNVSMRSCMLTRSLRRLLLNSENDHCGVVGSLTSWKRDFTTRYSLVPRTDHAKVPSGRGLLSAVLLLSNHRWNDCSLPGSATSLSSWMALVLSASGRPD